MVKLSLLETVKADSMSNWRQPCRLAMGIMPPCPVQRSPASLLLCLLPVMVVISFFKSTHSDLQLIKTD